MKPPSPASRKPVASQPWLQSLLAPKRLRSLHHVPAAGYAASILAAMVALGLTVHAQQFESTDATPTLSIGQGNVETRTQAATNIVLRPQTLDHSLIIGSTTGGAATGTLNLNSTGGIQLDTSLSEGGLGLLTIGSGTGAIGNLNITGAATVGFGSEESPAGSILIGLQGGSGFITQDNASSQVSLIATEAISFGQDAGSSGTYTLTRGNLILGSSQGVIFGETAGATGTFLQQTNATAISRFILGDVTVGQAGTGNFSVYRGVATLDHSLIIADAAGSKGTVIIGADRFGQGTLEIGGTDGIRAGSGTAKLDLIGGQIRVIGADLTTSLGIGLTTSTISGSTYYSTVDTNGWNAVFNGKLTGTGLLTKRGVGTLSLSAANDYSGGTTVNGGTLAALHANAVGTGVLTINGGALELGNGLASVLNLQVSSLQLSGTNPTLHFDIGTAAQDKITVTGTYGNSSSSAVISIRPQSGLGVGTYTLIAANSVSTTIPTLSGLLSAGYQYSLNRPNTQQLNLVISQTNLNYWDGTQTTANNQVDGGDGTWQRTTGAQWTNTAGSANALWTNGRTAVFGGSFVGDTALITVNSPHPTLEPTQPAGNRIEVGGLHFLRDGYTLRGGTFSTSTSYGNLVDLRVVQGATATVESRFYGSAGISKNDLGTLVLKGSSNFGKGGIIVNFGTLVFDGGKGLKYDVGGPADYRAIVGNNAGDDATLVIRNGGAIGWSSEVTGVKLHNGYIGYAAGSKGVATITGANSNWSNDTSLYVGYAGTGTLHILDGGRAQNDSVGIVAYEAGSTGHVVINGADSVWENASYLSVGRSGNATLLIENGGKVISVNTQASGNPSGYIAQNSGSVASVKVTGTGSWWENTRHLYVGYDGQGSLLIENGGKVTSTSGYINGTSNSTTSQVTITGENSVWETSATGVLFVNRGNAAEGTLNLVDQGKVKTGSIEVDKDAVVNIGAAQGKAALAPGLIEANEIRAYQNTTSTANTLQFNHTATDADAYYFTKDGTASGAAVNIAQKLQVVHTAGTTVFTGTKTYTGATKIQGGHLIVDGSLTGTALSVHSGATLSGDGSITGAVVSTGGRINPGHAIGTLTVGSLHSDALTGYAYALGTPDVIGGSTNDHIQVTGALTIQGGVVNLQSIGGTGTYTLIKAGSITAGYQAPVLGLTLAGYNYQDILVDTADNSVKLTVDYAGLGFWDGAAGGANNLQIEGGDGDWNLSSPFWTDEDGKYNSAWNNASLLGAVFTGNAGTVRLTSDVSVGEKGLQFITGGYTLTGEHQISLEGDVTEITVDANTQASTVETNLTGLGTLLKNGAGTLVLTGKNDYGTASTNDAGTIVRSGILHLRGGSIEHATKDFLVGDLPTLTAQVEVSDGGKIQSADVYLGGESSIAGTGHAIVRGAGSKWQVDGDITVRNDSSLTVADAGKVSVKEGSGLVTLAPEAGAGGTLRIGNGGKAGIIEAAEIHGGAGEAKVIFAHQESAYTFAPKLTGDLEVSIASGVTAFTQANSYTGGTTLLGGTLLANNTDGSATGSGDVFLAGGKLGGSGFISGAVRFTGPAVISPGNSPGVLTVSGLHLRPDSVLEFELGAPGTTNNDRIDVSGDLTLAGLLRIIDAGGFTQGTYRLINYGGVLVNVGLTLQSVPTGVNPGDLVIDTVTHGQVNLLYQRDAVTGGFQYWDGAHDRADGRIHGGSGIWTAAGTNWTNAQGQVNGPWAGETAFFTATPGTVSLGSDIPFQKLIFEVGGYRVDSPWGYQLTSAGPAVIETRTGRTTLAAPLQVAGVLYKTGAGLLDLRSSAVTGGTHIQQGTLAVNGVLRSPYVQVQPGTTLQGTGLIIGHVFNAGTVAPGNSIGTLSIHGNYTQRRQGTLQIEVANPRHHDVLAVSGTARLAGLLDVQSLGAKPKYGDQIVFLQASRIVGDFDRIQVDHPDRYRGRFFTAAQDRLGVLLYAPTSYTLVARTDNEHRLARALDHWIGIEDGDIGEVTLALDLQRSEQYAQSFAAISPAYYEGALRTASELSQSHTQLLHQQLHARRLANRNTGTSTDSGIVTPSTKNPKNVKAVSPVQEPTAEELRWSAWTQGSGLFSSGGLSLTPGEDFESGTIQIGADYRLHEHLALGLFASYQEGWGDYDHGGNIDLDATRFGAYATYDRGGFYANAALGGGQSSFDIKRPIRWSYLDRTAQSDPEGWEFFSSLSSGFDLQRGNWTFGPQFSVQYSKLNLDSFREQGAGSLDLHLRDADIESLRSYLGARVAYTHQVNERLAVIPELRAFWQHEYLQGGSASARLQGGQGPAFSHSFSDPDADSVFLGAGLGIQIGPRFYGNLYYNADLGRNGGENHIISISATLKF